MCMWNNKVIHFIHTQCMENIHNVGSFEMNHTQWKFLWVQNVGSFEICHYGWGSSVVF